MSPRIALVNGPNLNLLGFRQPHLYGSETLADIQQRLLNIAQTQQVNLDCFQSNHEGILIDYIQEQAKKRTNCLLLNLGAYTHTSIALRDAVLSTNIPCIEIHLSNICAREGFRRVSYLQDIAIGVISGFGSHSYELALLAAIRHVQTVGAREVCNGHS